MAVFAISKKGMAMTIITRERYAPDAIGCAPHYAQKARKEFNHELNHQNHSQNTQAHRRKHRRKGASATSAQGHLQGRKGEKPARIHSGEQARTQARTPDGQAHEAHLSRPQDGTCEKTKHAPLRVHPHEHTRPCDLQGLTHQSTNQP